MFFNHGGRCSRRSIIFIISGQALGIRSLSSVSLASVASMYPNSPFGYHQLLEQQLHLLHLQPSLGDPHAYARLLQMCTILKDLPSGKRVHAHIIRSGLERHLALAHRLVDMYCKCGSLEEALRILDNMKERTVCLWTVIIGAYFQQRGAREALQVFQRMQQEGIKPDKATFVNVLSACAGLKAVAEGKLIHVLVVESGFESDVLVGNSLLNMYSKCGSLAGVRRTFDRMQQRNVVSWTTMIAAYAKDGHTKEALQLFTNMQAEGVKPNDVTFLSVLSACASPAALEEGRMIHARIVENGFETNVLLNTALVNMYAKCGSVQDARQVFEGMRQRDVVSWTVMITAYTQQGKLKDAVQLVQRMLREGMKPNNVIVANVLSACAKLKAVAKGKVIHNLVVHIGLESNVVVGTALVNMYAKFGRLLDAERIFDRMHERNVFSWTNMISAYAQQGQGKKAFHLFHQMLLLGVQPNEITYSIVLSACASLADLGEGKAIHTHIVESGFESDVGVGTALVNMYAKCGKLEDARRVFDRLEKRNITSWTVMISAYAQHGKGKEAIQLFHLMQLEGVKPNVVTYCSVLSACASPADLAEGKMIHSHFIESGSKSSVRVENFVVSMYAKCGSMEDAQIMFDRLRRRGVLSYTAMITAYARQGQGKQALEIFQQMRLERVNPNKFTFISVLSACASLAALAEGKMIHACIVESGFESDNAVQSALANMYAKCGSVEDAQELNASKTMLESHSQLGQGKELSLSAQPMEKAVDVVCNDDLEFSNQFFKDL